MRFPGSTGRSIVLIAALSTTSSGVVPLRAGARATQIDYAALRDETVKAMSEYLQINTTNPPGNELSTATWLKAFLAKEGIEGEILDTAELGAGRAELFTRD